MKRLHFILKKKKYGFNITRYWFDFVSICHIACGTLADSMSGEHFEASV
tara:strand:- start:61632 stop:61778 length:147 start_codon:yes stop_codon:yes gene_type:complete